jgi:hypothetical protein
VQAQTRTVREASGPGLRVTVEFPLQRQSTPGDAERADPVA